MEIYHPKDEELLREMRRVRRVRKRSRLLWGLFISLLLCAATGWFLYVQYFTLAVMEGPAMGETLPGGSLVLVRRNPAEGYRSGDVVLYTRENGRQMKRILAVGGDRVVFSPYSMEELRVNGQDLQEPYITGRAAETGLTTRRITVPDNELFVVGDQRSLSVDSRSRDYGTIPAGDVIGRVEFVLWPLYRFGTVRQNSGGSGTTAGTTAEQASETAASEEGNAEETPAEGQTAETASPADGNADGMTTEGQTSETGSPEGQNAAGTPSEGQASETAASGNAEGEASEPTGSPAEAGEQEGSE